MLPRRTILLWLWLGFTTAILPLLGQQPAFRRYGLRDGLPQSQVTALLEDHRGFLWVGTNTGGVARLGASGFRTFAGPQGLKALFIRGLMEDASGGIWVASQEGVSEIRGETVLNYGPAQGLETSDAVALGLDDQDRVLVGTRRGLFRLEAGRFHTVQLPAPWPGGPIRRLARDHAKGLWIVGQDTLVARWDAQGLHPYPLPPTPAGTRIRDLQVDPKGRAWLLLDTALLRMERGQWVKEPLANLPPSPRMVSLRFDARGDGYQITLGGDGVLVKEEGQHARLLTAAMGLPRDRIFVAMRDRRGVLWVGSDGDGLAAQALPGLWTVDGAAQLAGKDLAAVTAVQELGGGRYLLGSSTGLYQVDEGRGLTGHWTTANGMPANPIWELLQDGRGGVWVGTDRGLAHWKAGRVASAGPKEMSRVAVLTLIHHAGTILAGTDQGLFELDLQGRLRAHLRLPPEIGEESIPDILPYQGRLLLATSSGLWERVDGRLQRSFTDAPFAASTVTAITLDARGRLWIGTMKGLHVWMDGHWASFGIADGLPDEGINFIVDVGQGRMAIGHNKGVTFLEGRSLHHLSRSQGLISEETNHDGFLLDSKGRFWIGMIGGVCILQDVRTFRNAPLPAPALLEVRWPGGSQVPPVTAQVPPRPDFLDLSFDTGDPLVPSRISYQAYLQGVDDGWRPVSQSLTLQYRNLKAGFYRFHLRASTDGVTWTEGAPVSIEVAPAWYERWLVRGLLGLALVALLGWILWLRVHALAQRARDLEETIEDRTLLLARQNRALEQAHQQIKRSLEERLKLLDMVTHDLRSPLTTILLTLDRLHDLVPGHTNLLDVMEREANRIEALARNLLDQSRSEALLQSLKLVPIPPAEVTEGFEEVLRLKTEAAGLHFHLEISPETERVDILADPATLQQVMLNLFENALKFTPEGGQVGLRSTVDRAGAAWVLEVWDTGRGLDPAKIQELLQPFGQTQAGDAAKGWGLGLSICQSIVDAHHGELKIDSEPGQGARFRVVLPLCTETP
ncbi:sensor histidine kinase [Geothrix sp.]|jgi:signal transduction histidine kinase/ligand-binding sensor domain-containing protein|uniref:sensor histidine kinase n=1 Tax=Geothrix sp. TaxID=1962974 RepID=UPI0025BBD7B7|nr:sensor histidine kinase [Geothrix sp.]